MKEKVIGHEKREGISGKKETNGKRILMRTIKAKIRKKIYESQKRDDLEVEEE